MLIVKNLYSAEEYRNGIVEQDIPIFFSDWYWYSLTPQQTCLYICIYLDRLLLVKA